MFSKKHFKSVIQLFAHVVFAPNTVPLHLLFAVRFSEGHPHV